MFEVADAVRSEVADAVRSEVDDVGVVDVRPLLLRSCGVVAVVALVMAGALFIPGTRPASAATPTDGGDAVNAPAPAVAVASHGRDLAVAHAGEALRITPPDAIRWQRNDAVRLQRKAANFTSASTSHGVAYQAVPQQDGVTVTATLQKNYDGDALSFDIGLPSGSMLQPEADGSVAVVGADGVSTSGFEAPWAVDANGKTVDTHYVVDGSTIVQQVDVDASTAYPVVADPKFTTGWVTGTVYFNILETLDWTTAGAAGSAAACGALALYNLFLGGVCILGFGAIVVQAHRAKNRNMCLKIKFAMTALTPAGGPIWPDIYSGGYCTK